MSPVEFIQEANMGVVQGPDGRIYEIPDDELSRYAVPEARLEEVLNGVSFQTPSDQDGRYVWPWGRLGQPSPSSLGQAVTQSDSAYPGADGPGNPGSGGGPPA